MVDDTSGGYGALARKIRSHSLRMTHKAKSSHIGTCLSMADILAVLYSKILDTDPKDPDKPGRDRFILSKGHGSAALYAVLAERGFFKVEELGGFCENESPMTSHIAYGVKGVEVSTGSLGHGLSMGCGMALSSKLVGPKFRVFVLLSDGECDEGSVWEAALFAGQHSLDNLVVIVDYNKIQSFGRVEEVLDLEPFAEKWRSFGFACVEVDGHDFKQVEGALSKVPLEKGKPTCVIAHTVKGKGVSFMENRLEWHYRSVDASQLQAALDEVEGGK